MDAKTLGRTVAQLRKKMGMTQAELAKRLNVSDKTISKWENGQGYPEITQLPVLASLFGVSIDYLMTGERKGIVLAGNILTDLVKVIDYYPSIGMLSNITSVSRAVGGSVPNTGIDIAKIDRSVPLTAIGRVGDDDHGRYVVSQLQRHGIDVSHITVSHSAPTSSSDVMSLPSGERTFFHTRGANAEFSPNDIDIASLQCNILHIGYLLLLDSFDARDEEYGTVMARFLHQVQQRGIKTSIDVVSDSGADYHKTIVPALRYCDYAIVNEIECCTIWNLDPRHEDGSLNVENIRLAMSNMKDCGVADKVVVHCKEAGFCLDVKTDAFTMVPSLKIPADQIKGSVGAGDAYCAGCLYSLYNHYSDQDMLEFASAAAACNLFAENAVDGMRPRNEILRVAETYGRLTL